MPNFAPNELVTRDDRDSPRMNCYIKNLIVAIDEPFSNMNNCFMPKNLQNQLIQLIFMVMI